MHQLTGMLVVTAVLACTSVANAVTLTRGSQFIAMWPSGHDGAAGLAFNF